MKLHCLGTTGFHPSPTRHTACYYLPELDLVLDAGTGIFRLVDYLLKDPKESLTILLSHAHLDHVVGLTFLVDALAVTPLKHVKVIGDAEKLTTVKEHLYNELLFPVAPCMEFEEFPSERGTMYLESLEFDWFPLEHPGGSLGFRFRTQNKSFAYVTDTVARPDADYLSHIHECDLLLHECYFGDEHEKLGVKTGHSWLSAVNQVVETTHPKKTALIHINPLAEILGTEFELSEHQQKDLNMCIATDGLVLDF